MGVFDLVLLLIGVVLVIISFLVTEKLSGKHSQSEYIEFDTEDYKEKVEAIKQDIEDYLEKAKETTIDSINDSLCHLSNEKIMNINEYGDMVLDRIDKNHSEVVFLYGMLEDKEKEIKQMLLKPNQKEIALKETVELKKKGTRETINQARALMASEGANIEQTTPEPSEEDNQDAYKEKQKSIIELHKQGKSVLEISKQLDIGQGEVQLTVNMFTGGMQ